MKVHVIASGSKANVTYVETNECKILIDIGLTKSKLVKKLAEIDVKLSEITHILVTHLHGDHVRGLKMLLKSHRPTLMLTPKMQKALSLDNYGNVIHYQPEMAFMDVKILVLPTSHDTEESFGFVINHQGRNMVHITDTGYINEKVLKYLKNRHLYIIESNHDVEMLLNGSYYYGLKRRVLSDNGHLSNQACATYLKMLVGDKTENIVLAHLSENNNEPDLALKTIKDALGNKYKKNISVAKQDEILEVIEV